MGLGVSYVTMVTKDGFHSLGYQNVGDPVLVIFTIYSVYIVYFEVFLGFYQFLMGFGADVSWASSIASVKTKHGPVQVQFSIRLGILCVIPGEV